jgi:hypothetical protein
MSRFSRGFERREREREKDSRPFEPIIVDREKVQSFQPNQNNTNNNLEWIVH